jgi:hypothetical protein
MLLSTKSNSSSMASIRRKTSRGGGEAGEEEVSGGDVGCSVIPDKIL